MEAVSDAGQVSRRRARRLAVVIGLNAVVVAVEVVGGWYGRSMALVADAGHNLSDIAALALALLAVRLARRPPTRSKSFGYHRSGVLAAQANAAGVLVVCALIAAGAVARLARPEHVRGGTVLVTALGALVLNTAAMLLLREKGGRDHNMAAAALHMAGDAASSAVVAAVGLVALAGAHWPWLDPAVSLAIAVLIGAQALTMGKKVADVLLEGAPLGTDAGALTTSVISVAGVDEVHDLHIWSLSSEVVLLSAHLVMSGHPSLEEAQAVAGRVRAMLAGDFGIAHATLELECETCGTETADVCAMGPPPQSQFEPLHR